MNGNDDFYIWLTEELGYDPEEAFDIAMGPEEEPGAREPSVSTATEEEPAPDPVKQVSSVLLANEAMKREEEGLEKLWNIQGRPQVTPEMARGVNVSPVQYGQVMPTSRGFNYMGTLAPPTGGGYDRMLASGMIQKPADPTVGYNPQALAEYQARQPGGPNPNVIGVQTNIPQPAPTANEMQFQAQQGYLNDLQRGVPKAQAMQKWGPLMLSGTGAAQQFAKSATAQQGMTPYQQAQSAHWQSLQEAAKNKPVLTKIPTTPGIVTAQFKQNNAEIRDLQGRIDATPSDPRAAQWQTRIDSLRKENQDLLNRFSSGTGTGTTGITRPAGSQTGIPRVGMVYKGYRFKGGNPREQSNWEKL